MELAKTKPTNDLLRTCTHTLSHSNTHTHHIRSGRLHVHVHVANTRKPKSSHVQKASNNDSTVYGHMQIVLSNVIQRSGFTSTLSITAGTTQLCGLWNYIHVHVHVGMHALYMYILTFISKSTLLL